MKSKNSRAPKGGGMIRKRPDGLWEGRITAGYDPKTGKQIRRSVYGKTQQEVRQRITEMAHEIDTGTYLEPLKTTVGEWLDIWLKQYVANTVAAYTWDSYERAVRNHIKPELGNVKLVELTPLQIQIFYNRLMTEKGLSAKTVKNINGVFHRSLEKALQLGYLRVNPTNACDLPKTKRKEIHPMEEEDIVRFLDAIRDHRFGNIYWVTLFTGMRQGEVLGLTWDCVDFENNTILINKQLQKTKKVGGEYILTGTKNSRSRVITVAPSVMLVFQRQFFLQRRMERDAGPLWNNEWNLVFTNEFGRHLCHFTVYKAYKKIVAEIGLPEERFHDLRHSYAVAALECGDDIKTVQGNLGHATASFTLDVYGHVSQKMRQQSAERMEGFIQRTNTESA